MASSGHWLEEGPTSLSDVYEQSNNGAGVILTGLWVFHLIIMEKAKPLALEFIVLATERRVCEHTGPRRPSLARDAAGIVPAFSALSGERGKGQ